MTTWAANEDGTVSDAEDAVVAAVKRTIDAHCDKPFAPGYRIPVEEAIDGGILNEYIAGRAALIAAGGLRTPEQADAAPALGLSIAAPGRQFCDRCGHFRGRRFHCAVTA